MKIHSRFKSVCVACGTSGARITKEHFWPQWLIAHTGTHKTGVAFDASKRVNPRKLTVPLCDRCNSDFGAQLEQPVSRIFRELEAGQGLSDAEAELLVRWLWKFEGLAWSFAHPDGTYTEKYTLRERVLHPIDEIRDQLSLAISLAASVDPQFGDAPMGLDSFNRDNAIFVSAVFSRVALMVLLQRFEPQVPSEFSLHRLGSLSAPDRQSKLFFPKMGFATCVAAVERMRSVAPFLAYLHDTRGLGDAA